MASHQATRSAQMGSSTGTGGGPIPVAEPRPPSQASRPRKVSKHDTLMGLASRPAEFATAKVPRWEPIAMLCAVSHRRIPPCETAPATATRRTAAGSTTGMTFDVWIPRRRRTATTSRRCLPWSGCAVGPPLDPREDRSLFQGGRPSVRQAVSYLHCLSSTGSIGIAPSALVQDWAFPLPGGGYGTAGREGEAPWCCWDCCC